MSSFAARPRVINKKPKYREEEEEEQIGFQMNNLMWDKRVVRGNTYASIVATKTIQPISNLSNKKKPVKHQSQQDVDFNQRGLNRRYSIEIVTDEAVESLTDKPPVYQKDTQTQPLPSNPVVRYRMKPKTGKDIQTQILDSDLFNFNYQVEPLLRVLIGKTLEISRMQVLQEEELNIMHKKQQQFKELDEKESQKIRAMEQRQKKLAEQNQARKAQYRKKLERNIYTHKKIFSRVMAKQLMLPIKSATLSFLERSNFFREEFQFQLLKDILPNIYSTLQSKISTEGEAYDLLLEITRTQIELSVQQHARALQNEEKRRAKIIQQRLQRQNQKVERRLMRQEQRRSKAYEAFMLQQQRIQMQQQRESSQQQNESRS